MLYYTLTLLAMTDQELQEYLRDEVEDLQDTLRYLLTEGKPALSFEHAGQLGAFIEQLGGSDSYKLALAVDHLFEGPSLSDKRNDMRVLDIDLAAYRKECEEAFRNKAITKAGGLPDFNALYKVLNAVVGTEIFVAHAQAKSLYHATVAGALPLPEVLKQFDAFNPFDDDDEGLNN